MGNTIARVSAGLSNKKEVRIVMFGLDNTGKTTILYKLKFAEYVQASPTHGNYYYKVETVTYKNIHFTIWDVNVQLWKNFINNTNGAILVIDSSDRERINQMENIMRGPQWRDHHENIVLLVLANKKDLPNRMKVEELKTKLRMDLLENCRWHIQETCGKTGEGLQEGLEWLYTQLND